MEAIKNALLFSLWGAPVWAYLALAALGAVEYALPRVGNPKARSIGELVANALAKVLGRFPVLGPLLRILGTPQPAPSPLAESAADKAASQR